MRVFPAKAALIAIWLAGPAGAAAQTPDATCAALRLIVAAAEAEPPFEALQWEPHSPWLDFDNCSVLDMSMEGDSPDFGCVTDFADAARRWDALNADVLRCLQGAERYDDPGWRAPSPPHRWSHLRIGRVRIHIHDGGYANLPQRYVAIHIGVEGVD